MRFLRTATLLLVGLLLAACGTADRPASTGTTAPDTPAVQITPALPPLCLAGAGAQTYTIVRSEEASQDEIAAAVFLNKYLTKCGVETTITTDWKKNPVSDYELVVGQTLRSESDAGFTLDPRQVGDEGYFITVSGSRIYLMGGSTAATQDAVEHFLTEFFGYAGDPETAAAAGDVTVPGDYVYLEYEAYPLSAVRVDGQDLRDFKIAWDSSLDAAVAALAAEHIQTKLCQTTGIWLPIAETGAAWDGPTLRLSGKEPGKAGSFTMTVEEGDLVLSTAVPGGLTRGFAEFVNDRIRGVKGELDMNQDFRYETAIGEYVTYSQFGAKGDGKTNDIEALRAAHEYANANGLEVRADYGATYYIGAVDNAIHVRTSTDWTGASFTIDDSNVGLDKRGVSIFYVVPDKAAYSITDQIKTASRDQTKFDITLPEDSILVLTETGTKRYIREGANANAGSDQVDIVVVDKNGNIDMNAPLIWDYTNVTSVKVYPMDEEPLILRGGTFTTIANNQPSASTYYKRGIHVARSNVIVEDLVHYVEGEGAQGAPYNGILTISDCANVTVRDCVFTAHKTYTNSGIGLGTVSQGTYDIAPARVVNLTFENCTQTTDILNTKYWGIMGSNFCKNIVLRDCTFSRFDAHQGVANVTILGSTLGHQCLNAIGCGTLRVEDSTLYGTSFINLRSDYGSTWEGDVIIRNCTWVPNKGNTITGKYAVIGGSYSGYHNFGYECCMPANITIENLYVNDALAGSGYEGIYLFGNITTAHTSEAYEADVAKNGYPYHITENLTISGFSSASGKKWLLSPNEFMFRSVKVTDLDAAN